MSIRIAYGSVNLDKLTPPMVLALIEVESAYAEYGYDCWITSANDLRHSAGSLHYTGNALDFRTRHVPKAIMNDIAARIKRYLSPIFDVILEHDHLHVEFDPR